MNRLVEGLVITILAALIIAWNSTAALLVAMAGLIYLSVSGGRISEAVASWRWGSPITLSLIDHSGAKTNRQVAQELVKGRKYGIVALQNRIVTSVAEQDRLDKDRLEWKAVMMRRMDGYVDASDIGDFETLGTYQPKGLRPRIREMSNTHPDFQGLAARNSKHRNEMAARLDLLRQIAKKLEQQPG